MAQRHAGDAVGVDEALNLPRVVAGVGFRRNASAEAIDALIRRALAAAHIAPARVGTIATALDRAADASIRAAAARFGLVPLGLAPDALRAVDAYVPTRSARIERTRGVGSLAEAAALAGAGVGATLVAPRIDDGAVTCALALVAQTP